MDVQNLCDIAIKAALAAGKIIQNHMNHDVQVHHKNVGSSRAAQVVTAVDVACEKVIFAHLYPTCEAFSLAILSEETVDDGSRLKKDFFWCIDPMDGTLAFINKKSGFSVSIALIAKDGTPYIGVVFDPSTNHLYYAIKGKGAYKNHAPLTIQHTNNYLTYVTDRALEDTLRANEIQQLLNQKKMELGLKGIKEIAGAGAVLNAILVLENKPACMLKFPKPSDGGGSIWDYAATACIYNELGLPATTFEGEKLDLNRKESTFMNHQGVFYSNF